MGAYGEVGVLLSRVELMGWDYGRISGKGGILSEALLDMWWENISFWHDLWCGNSVLKLAFLVLYGIARKKNASAVDNLEVLRGSNQ
jgi:hypothetical protein